MIDTGKGGEPMESHPVEKLTLWTFWEAWVEKLEGEGDKLAELATLLAPSWIVTGVEETG